MKCACNILVGKFGGKIDSEEGAVIQWMFKNKGEGVNWIELAQDRVQCLAFVNIMNLGGCCRGLRILRSAEELSAFQQRHATCESDCCVTV
jgi:hypothetical protein